MVKVKFYLLQKRRKVFISAEREKQNERLSVADISQYDMGR